MLLECFIFSPDAGFHFLSCCCILFYFALFWLLTWCGVSWKIGFFSVSQLPGLKAPPQWQDVMSKSSDLLKPHCYSCTLSRAYVSQWLWLPLQRSTQKQWARVGCDRWLVCLWLWAMATTSIYLSCPYSSFPFVIISLIVCLPWDSLFSSQGCRYSFL